MVGEVLMLWFSRVVSLLSRWGKCICMFDLLYSTLCVYICLSGCVLWINCSFIWCTILSSVYKSPSEGSQRFTMTCICSFGFTWCFIFLCICDEACVTCRCRSSTHSLRGEVSGTFIKQLWQKLSWYTKTLPWFLWWDFKNKVFYIIGVWNVDTSR